MFIAGYKYFFLSSFKHIECIFSIFFFMLFFQPANVFSLNKTLHPNILLGTEEKLEIVGVIKGDHKPLEKALVLVYENDKKTEEIYSDYFGEFVITCNLNSLYRLEITKQNYVTKKFIINTTVPDNKDIKKIYFFDFMVNLFELFDDPELSILEKPIGIIKYDKNIHNFSYDKDYSKKLISKLDSITNRHAQKIKDYNKAITDGNDNYKSGKYEQAKINFETAQVIFPKESYPKERLSVIYSILKTQQELEEKYKKIIIEGDKADSSRNYLTAIEYYSKALELKTNDPYSQNKIQQIKKILDDQKNSEQAYTKYIYKGDSLFRMNSFSKSLDAYKRALSIKPDERYPEDQINQINLIFSNEQKFKQYNISADSALKSKNPEYAKMYYQKALYLKPNDQSVKEQIIKVNQVIEKNALLLAENNKYNELIKTADNLLQTKQYEDAENTYQQASAIKPDEKYPIRQVMKIKNTLKVIAEKKAIQDKYDKYILLADQFYQNGELDKAFENYQNAKQLIPEETYAGKQIEKIKPEISQLKSIMESYSLRIAEADKYFANKDYDNATTNYQLAVRIKPNEHYPKQKIEEINKIKEKIKHEEYLKLISEAENTFSTGNLDKTLEIFNKASDLQPNEEYPKNRILEITALKYQKQKNDKTYATYIEKGENSFRAFDYMNARNAFNEASLIKPNEQYPLNKIAEINKLLRDNFVNDSIYNSLMKEADNLFKNNDFTSARMIYVQAHQKKPEETQAENRIYEIDSHITAYAQKEYQKIIAKADEYYNKNDLKNAKEYYKKAFIVMPGQEYPKEQIGIIDIKLVNDEYQNLIKLAEYAFNQKDYSHSKNYYTQALFLKPKEIEPKKKISELNALIKESEFANAIYKIKSEIIENNSVKKFSFDPLNSKSSKNYILVKARNLSGKPFKIILNYGKDELNSGGTVMKIEETTDIHEYNVIVGTQSNWLLTDNNWLSISPVGGRIEILGIQIKEGQ